MTTPDVAKNEQGFANTVADVIAEELVGIGVKTVYGLPGGENVMLLDAFRRRGIRFVLVKNESSACYMADVSARLSGVPGVVLTTLGPGATNAYVGVAHAYLDRAPLLILTAETEPALIGTHTHQLLDLEACMRPVTKWTASLDEMAPRATVRRALQIAQSGRPGPVHLSLSNVTASKYALDVAGSDGPPHKPIGRPMPSAALFDAAARTIDAAQRPLIVVGLGLEPSRPYEQIRLLAEALDAPVIDTPKSKGILSADHPLFVGTIGLTRDDPAYEVLDETDCLIAVGFDVVELVKPWRQPQPLIWIADWHNVDPALPAEVELIGSPVSILDELSAGLAHRSLHGWGRERVQRFRQVQARRVLPAAMPGRLLPQELLATLRSAAPDDVIITTDVGSHKIFTALDWDARTPNRYFLSNGLSAMGFGVCGALAAALETSQQVVCVTGDAGAAMVFGELMAATDEDLPLLILLMNDGALDLIRTAQQRRERPVYGTEFSNPNFELLAAAYGIDYACVGTVDACDLAIRAALVARKPALLDVQIDPAGYPTAVRIDAAAQSEFPSGNMAGSESEGADG